ncbi:hypothetical protein HOY80DRAFT_1034403 [Tuber brumale]|nr:hypothetical protein HOY80DRAFT_1034403 [Tuber brumale]
MHKELAEKPLLRYNLLDDVDAGSYKNREASHKRKRWLDLVAMRERPDEITIVVVGLRPKLKKFEPAGGN